MLVGVNTTASKLLKAWIQKIFFLTSSSFYYTYKYSFQNHKTKNHMFMLFLYSETRKLQFRVLSYFSRLS